MEHVHDSTLVAAADGGGTDSQVQRVKGARECHEQIRLVLASDTDDGGIRILFVVELDQQRLHQEAHVRAAGRRQRADTLSDPDDAKATE